MNDWLASTRPDAKLRLFCLPYAGGGSVEFHGWRRQMPQAIDICPVLLPGRERRLREPAIPHIEPLVETLAQALEPAIQQGPFALFGHSMGAWIAFELARQLRRNGQNMPVHLFASARRAPHLPGQGQAWSKLPDDQFLNAIQDRYGSIPQPLFDDPKLLALFLPALRADFTLVDSYQHREEPPLAVPIDAYRGEADAFVSPPECLAWQQHSTGAFSLETFPGEHFFLRDSRELLVAAIARRLDNHL
ncbi:MAG: thioesterase domain-containing protein [Planctomycetota bacterium]|nr:thioesterase domain-containing protein [Planctomycetota bacterium]